MGLVGIIAARHLVDELGMEYVGGVTLEGIPPVASIRRGVALPPVRIYAHREKKILCVFSDVSVPEPLADDIAKALVSFAKEKGIARIVSIAGIIVPGEGEGVYAVGATERDLHEATRWGLQPVEKGVTTGISAALLMRAAEAGVPAMLILGQLHTKEDFRAAADVIRKLDEMLGLNVDVGGLLEKAEAIEREVAEILDRMKSRQPAPSMYG